LSNPSVIALSAALAARRSVLPLSPKPLGFSVLSVIAYRPFDRFRARAGRFAASPIYRTKRREGSGILEPCRQEPRQMLRILVTPPQNPLLQAETTMNKRLRTYRWPAVQKKESPCGAEGEEARLRRGFKMLLNCPKSYVRSCVLNARLYCLRTKETLCSQNRLRFSPARPPNPPATLPGLQQTIKASLDILPTHM